MVYPFFQLSGCLILCCLSKCCIVPLTNYWNSPVFMVTFFLIFSAFSKASPLILEPVMSVEVNIPQEFQVRSGVTLVKYFWNCWLLIIQTRIAHHFHKPWLKISCINWAFILHVGEGLRSITRPGAVREMSPRSTPLPHRTKSLLIGEEQDRGPVSPKSR